MQTKVKAKRDKARQGNGRVFFRAPFSRSRSVVEDCFTGQSPGKAIKEIYVYNIYIIFICVYIMILVRFLLGETTCGTT